MPWRSWRKAELGGDDGRLDTWLARRVCSLGWDMLEQRNCNILQRITRLQGSRRTSEDFALRNANQGVSERRVTSASKCLEALDTRLLGVPCSGGGVKSSAGSEEWDRHGQTWTDNLYRFMLMNRDRRVTDDTIL